MLASLLSHSRFDGYFQAVISTAAVDSCKPHPAVYRSAVEGLGLPADEIALVSSNGFDIAGAKAFGLRTIRIARIARMPGAVLRAALSDPARLAPRIMFAALRSQPDAYAGEPDFSCPSLAGLVAVAACASMPSAPK